MSRNILCISLALVSIGTVRLMAQKLPSIIPVETVQAYALIGETGQLPCNVSTPRNDEVRLILWYRETILKPIYSFDMRNRSGRVAVHWADDNSLKQRAKFDFKDDISIFRIKKVQKGDDGNYRCRVDYKVSATKNIVINLDIIYPPSKPRIMDGSGQDVQDIAGPYHEGDNLLLICEVYDGLPIPSVAWFEGNTIIDATSYTTPENFVKNDLHLPRLSRSHLNRVLKCVASNNNLKQPEESIVTIDMYLKPLQLKIVDDTPHYSTKSEYSILCETYGSRPGATMTWYLGEDRLKNSRITHAAMANVTRSVLVYNPKVEDDGKELRCIGENKHLADSRLEDRKMLKIFYKPIVTLKLGTSLSIEKIREGSDVYFECHVKANPPTKFIEWKRQGALLEFRSSKDIKFSDQSLVLQNVTKQSSGYYTCGSKNSQGYTESNSYLLNIKYVPVCKKPPKKLFVSKGELVEIVCEVQADPDPNIFTWNFKLRSSSNDRITQDRLENNGSRSVLKFTPDIDQDFGVLHCFATNSVGIQKDPCKFEIVRAERPQPLQNCSVGNRTLSSFDIRCESGFDGGLLQRYHLQIFNGPTNLLLQNQTNSDAPQFMVSGLMEDSIYTVKLYSVNEKGSSQEIALHVRTLKGELKEPSPSSTGTIFEKSMMLEIVIGCITGLALMMVIICFSVKICNKVRSDRQQKKAWIPPDKSCTPLGKEYEEVNEIDDANPDLIPQRNVLRHIHRTPSGEIAMSSGFYTMWNKEIKFNEKIRSLERGTRDVGTETIQFGVSDTLCKSYYATSIHSISEAVQTPPAFSMFRNSKKGEFHASQVSHPVSRINEEVLLKTSSHAPQIHPFATIHRPKNVLVKSSDCSTKTNSLYRTRSTDRNLYIVDEFSTQATPLIERQGGHLESTV